MNKYTLIYLLCLGSLVVSGQVDSTALEAEKVEVIKRYEAAILQARKKKISFAEEEKTFAPINYSYQVTTEKVIDFDRPDPEIKALSYKGEPTKTTDLKDGYVYGGYGTHNTVNAGAAYHYYIEDWLDAGFKIDHLSAQDSINSYASAISHTQGDVYLGHYLGKHTKVSLNGFTKLMNHKTDVFTDETGPNVPINKFGGDFDFSHNVFESKGFSARLKAGYDYAVHKRDQEINDRTFTASANLFKSISNRLNIEVPVKYMSVSAFELDTSKLTRNDLILEPNLRYGNDNFLIKGGLQYIKGDSASYFFPIIDVSLPSIVADLSLRLFTESQYYRNSLFNLSDLNPYYYAFSTDYSPNYLRSYKLEATYPLNEFSFTLGLAYNQYVNTPNFIESLERRGSASYIDRDEFSVQPRINYQLNEEVNFHIEADYNFFLTDLIATGLYYVPEFRLQVGGEQLFLNDKLVISESLEYQSVRETSLSGDPVAPSPVGPLRVAPSYTDLSLKVKYRISPSFDVFVKGTNLLGAEYFQWHRQAVFRQQIWGGLKFII